MANTNGTLYWWIANVAEKGKPVPEHVAFLREHLPRATAKLGSAPTAILCNPADREAIKNAFAGLTIGTLPTIPLGHFWIGAN